MPQARFPGTCQCGHDVPAGTEVRFTKNAAGRFVIASCPNCNPALAGRGAAGPAATAVEVRVRIQQVRSNRPDGTWTIASAVVDAGAALPTDTFIQAGRAFTVVGALGPDLKIGDVLEVRGTPEQHDRFGWQLKCDRAVPAVAATDAGLVAFLTRFPNVGQQRAEAILRTLGGRAAVIDALENDPSRLATVRGITEERAQQIAAEYGRKAGVKDALFFLSELGIPAGSAMEARIIEAFGAELRETISEDPYALMAVEGIGFNRADEVAKKMGVKDEDPRRTTAAVLALLEAAEQEGHTWSTVEDLVELASPRRR
jgi:hypothetical protein